MLKLTVNGQTHEFSGDPATPLLWVLRDSLQLTGTKYGCGMAQCGACTIHIDGTAQRACVYPVSAAVGKVITTIEGLSEDGSHPIQQAWITEQVPQCGFCQCGQIMQAASLLSKNAQPSDQEIIDAMSGNICRCGTYPRIHQAIKKAASKMSGVQTYQPNSEEKIA